ncbi:hypothetical protein BH18ACT9_BH18ACT9_05940 [soil metagenome]
MDDLPRRELAGRWPMGGQDALRDRLMSAYNDPTRGYHDLTHLAEVLTHIDELTDPAADRTAVLLAAWFHDAVYDDQGDLEDRSARLAEESLTAAGSDPGLVAEVARLVRLTRTHRPEPDDQDGEVLCDADLAILAAQSERYAAYVAGVRRDYAYVDEVAFRAARGAVLRELVGRTTLFHTPLARERWEGPARVNIARELAELAELDG